MPETPQDHDHGRGHGHAEVDFDSPEMAEYAELEGEVLLDLTIQAAGALADLGRQQGLDARRVVDLGSGPGVGTCALAQAFGMATVVAVDGAAAMLERARGRAERFGVGPRVDLRLAELPDGIDGLGPVDVAWASMALHHVGDETDALRRIGRQLVPGGLLGLVEVAAPVRILVDAVDDGLWDRVDAAWQAWFLDMRAGLPGAAPSIAYPSMIAAAGLELVADEVLSTVVEPPLDDAARRLSQLQIQQAAARLGEHAAAADLASLEELAAHLSSVDAAAGAGVRILASRHLFVARRPPMA